MTRPGYRWNHPSEWLSEKIGEWDEAELRSALFSLLCTLSEDDIQDVFQQEMSDDGYFEPRRDEDDPVYRCPKCGGPDEETDTPFVYPPSVLSSVSGQPISFFSEGVLVHAEGSISNRWADGTRGVPEELAEALCATMELPNCIACGAEVVCIEEEEEDE